jgi:ribosomal protein S12 methylthiotransferase
VAQTNIALITLGCDKNRVDSELILGILSNFGFKITPDINRADVIMVNTCGFIKKAKQESIRSILEALNYKKPSAKLIVCGCLAERYTKEIIEEIPEIDAIIGTGSYHKIAEIVQNVINNGENVYHKENNLTYPEDVKRIISTEKFSVYLKIAEGCDNRCGYCIIPKLRGHYRSRPIGKIIQEAKILAAEGARELIIIAQDITRYGMDLYGRPALAELLDKLSQIDGVHWIRLLYCYPDLINKSLIHIIANNPIICKYLDIPLQHSYDNILRKMGRRQKKSDIINLINTIRQNIPDVVIRTTFITGLPGETKEAFEDLLNFVGEQRFDRVGVFTYSREEGTRAAAMPDQVPKSIKILRYNRLMRLQQKISLELNKACVGKTMEILIEGYDDSKGMYFGRSYREAPGIDGLVYFTSSKAHEPGTFTHVKILKGIEYDLIGESKNEFSQ